MSSYEFLRYKKCKVVCDSYDCQLLRLNYAEIMSVDMCIHKNNTLKTVSIFQ